MSLYFDAADLDDVRGGREHASMLSDQEARAFTLSWASSDRAAIDSANKYTINLPSTYKNVLSIAVKQALVTKDGSNTPTLLVSVPGDSNKSSFNSQQLNRDIFGSMYLLDSASEQLWTRTNADLRKIYYPIIPVLNSILVEWVNPDGTPYTMAEHQVEFELMYVADVQRTFTADGREVSAADYIRMMRDASIKH